MLRDTILVAALTIAFATLVTAHCALVAELAFVARPRWRGLVALLVPPLAPVWGYRAGFRRTAFVWFGAVVAYTAALISAKATG